MELVKCDGVDRVCAVVDVVVVVAVVVGVHLMRIAVKARILALGRTEEQWPKNQKGLL